MIKEYQILIGLILIAIAVYYGLSEQPVPKTEFETCYDKATQSFTPIEATALCSKR